VKVQDLASRTASAITAGCVVLLLVTAALLASPAFRARVGFAPPHAGYDIGQRINLPSSAFGSADRALVLFASADCSACRRAKPFLLDLAKRADGQPATRFVVAMDVSAGEKTRADGVSYVRAIGLADERLMPFDPSTTRVQRLPTVLLVDRSGIVRGNWEPPFAQDDMLAALGAAHAIR
jgi:hypothetical protein